MSQSRSEVHSIAGSPDETSKVGRVSIPDLLNQIRNSCGQRANFLGRDGCGVGQEHARMVPSLLSEARQQGRHCRQIISYPDPSLLGAGGQNFFIFGFQQIAVPPFGEMLHVEAGQALAERVGDSSRDVRVQQQLHRAALVFGLLLPFSLPAAFALASAVSAFSSKARLASAWSCMALISFGYASA